MKRISSYQRRLGNIKFYKQRGKQLEDIIVDLGKELKKNNLQIPLWDRGVTGDMLLNDIGTGEFEMMIMNRIDQEVK